MYVCTLLAAVLGKLLFLSWVYILVMFPRQFHIEIVMIGKINSRASLTERDAQFVEIRLGDPGQGC